MENIRQAVERAKAGQSSTKAQVFDNLGLPQWNTDPGAETRGAVGPEHSGSELDCKHLMSRRIVSHNGADQRSRPYDMLRTQVLQTMALKGWRILGITSPTSGCGKTTTAINLAFSIARHPDQSVLLIDTDLQKAQIADCLGLNPVGGGVLDILQDRATLRGATIPIRAGSQRIVVLPTAATKESSELMASRAMRNLLQDIKKSREPHIVIVDLPPLLSSDDAISLLPHIDCVLLVAAVGLSKASEVEECTKHLHSSHLVRLVVNKATEPNSHYYY